MPLISVKLIEDVFTPEQKRRSPMKGIRVDPGRRRVRAQPGVIWGELDRETQAFGLAVTGGRAQHRGEPADHPAGAVLPGTGVRGGHPPHHRRKLGGSRLVRRTATRRPVARASPFRCATESQTATERNSLEEDDDREN